MASIRQSNFGAGELAPSLHGRTDMDRYQQGLRKLFNAFVSRQGACVSRPGTEYLGLAAATTVRLIPFAFSDTDTLQNYVLEFSAGSIRVRSGTTVIDVIGTVPYAAADLNSIRYQPTGDMIALACAGYAPAILLRHSATVWVYAPIVAPLSASAPAWDSGTTYTKGQMVSGSIGASSVMIAPNGGNYISLADSNTDNDPAQNPEWWIQVETFTRPAPTILAYISFLNPANDSHKASPSSYKYTVTYRETNGNEVESAAADIVPADLSDFVDWAAQAYVAGVCVRHGGKFYEATNTTAETDVPGVAAVWVVLGENINQNEAYCGRRIYNAGMFVLSGSSYYESLIDSNMGKAISDATSWVLRGSAALNGVVQKTYNLVAYPDAPLGVTINREFQAFTYGTGNVESFTIYVGANNESGWIGAIDATNDGKVTWFHDGTAPDLDRAPPQGINPFEIRDGDGTLLRTETPIAVAFFQDRLGWFGTTDTVANGKILWRPNYGFLSASGDYFNYDQRLVAEDDESLVFGLASRKREIIRAAVGVDRLLLFTGSSVWSISGAGGAPMAPDAIDAHVAVAVGSEWPVPLVMENTVLWVRDKGTGVRNATFDFQQSGYHSNDLSLTADHFFRGFQIVDWCWAEDPWSVVWAVRNDGTLLSLTYAPDEGVWGWGRHEILDPSTGLATAVQSVCNIPEGDEDAVYVAINGHSGGNARILRFGTRLEAPGKMAAPLDSYIAFTNPTITGGSVTLAGLDHLEGRSVKAVIYGTDSNDEPLLDSDGVIVPPTIAGPYTVNSGTVTVPVSGTRVSVFVGLPFTVDVQVLPLGAAREKQKVVTQVSLEAQANGTVYAGPDFSHLSPFTISASTDVAKIVVSGNWGTDGQAAVRVTDPVLFTLRAITREVDGGQR